MKRLKRESKEHDQKQLKRRLGTPLLKACSHKRRGNRQWEAAQELPTLEIGVYEIKQYGILLVILEVEEAK